MTAPRRHLLLATALLIAGCSVKAPGAARSLSPPARPIRAGASTRSAGPVSGAVQGRTPRPQTEVFRAVEAARALVGERDVVVGGRDYGPGCAALVRAALDAAGRPLPPSARDAAAIHAHAAEAGALRKGGPLAPGDLVFLADRAGGPPAHVGIVSRAEPDGTAVVLHRVSRGVVPLRLNLSRASRAEDPATGRRVNDALVVDGKRIPAGQLVVGVAALLRG